MTDANFGLDGGGAIDQIDAARVERFRRDLRTRRKFGGGPIGEKSRRSIKCAIGIDVAGDHDRAVVRDVVLGVVAADVVDGDARDRLGISDDRVSVRASAVDEMREAFARDCAGLVALLEQFHQPLGADTFEGRLRQHRLAIHIRENRERLGECARERIDGDVRGVPIGAAAERCAEEAEVFGEEDGIASAGAFIEQLAGERREAGKFGRVVIGAGTNQRADGNEWRVVILGYEQPQPVVEGAASDVREVIRPRRTRLRSDSPVDGHAFSGTKGLVTRFSATRYCRATRCRSSTVAARYGSSHVCTMLGSLK